MSYSFSQHARAMLQDAESALAGRRTRTNANAAPQPPYATPRAHYFTAATNGGGGKEYKTSGARRAIEEYETSSGSVPPAAAAAEAADWLADAALIPTSTNTNNANEQMMNDADAAVHALQRQLRHVMNDVIELRHELAAEREGRSTLVRSLVSRCKEEILAELRSTPTTGYSGSVMHEMNEMTEQIKARLRTSEEQQILTRRQVEELRRSVEVREHSLRDRDSSVEEELREMREKVSVLSAQTLAGGVDQAQQLERVKAELAQRLNRELQRYCELRQADQHSVREAGALLTRAMQEARAEVEKIVREALSQSSELVAAAVKNDLAALKSVVEQHTNGLQSLEQGVQDGLRQIRNEAHVQGATLIERVALVETNEASLKSRVDRAERNVERAQEIVARGEACVSVAQELAAKADQRAVSAMSSAQKAEQTVLDREARLQRLEARMESVASAEQMRAEVAASRHAVGRVETQMETLRALCTRNETLAERTAQSVEQCGERVLRCEQSVRQNIQWQEKTSASLAIKEEHVQQLTRLEERVAQAKEQAERGQARLMQTLQTVQTQTSGAQERQQHALHEVEESTNQLVQRLTAMESRAAQVEGQSESTRRGQEWLEKRITGLETSTRAQSSSEAELRLTIEELKANAAELRRQQQETQAAMQSRETRLQSGLDTLHSLETSFAAQCGQLESRLRNQISAWLKEYREQQHNRLGAQLQDAEQRQASLAKKTVQESLHEVEAQWMKALSAEVQRGQGRLERCEQHIVSLRQSTLDELHGGQAELRGEVEKALRQVQGGLMHELQALKYSKEEDSEAWRAECKALQEAGQRTQEEQTAMKAALERACGLVDQLVQRVQASEERLVHTIQPRREDAEQAAHPVSSDTSSRLRAAEPSTILQQVPPPPSLPSTHTSTTTTNSSNGGGVQKGKGNAENKAEKEGELAAQPRRAVTHPSASHGEGDGHHTTTPHDEEEDDRTIMNNKDGGEEEEENDAVNITVLDTSGEDKHKTRANPNNTSASATTLVQPSSITTANNNNNKTLSTNVGETEEWAGATPLPRLAVRQFRPIPADTTSSTTTPTTHTTHTTTTNSSNSNSNNTTPTTSMNEGEEREAKAEEGEKEEEEKNNRNSRAEHRQQADNNSHHHHHQQQNLTRDVQPTRPQILHVSLTNSASETSATSPTSTKPKGKASSQPQEIHSKALAEAHKDSDAAQPHSATHHHDHHKQHHSSSGRAFLDVETDFTLTTTTSETASGRNTPSHSSHASSGNNNNNSNNNMNSNVSREESERRSTSSSKHSNSSASGSALRSHHSISVPDRHRGTAAAALMENATRSQLYSAAEMEALMPAGHRGEESGEEEKENENEKEKAPQSTPHAQEEEHGQSGGQAGANADRSAQPEATVPQHDSHFYDDWDDDDDDEEKDNKDEEERDKSNKKEEREDDAVVAADAGTGTQAAVNTMRLPVTTATTTTTITSASSSSLSHKPPTAAAGRTSSPMPSAPAPRPSPTLRELANSSEDNTRYNNRDDDEEEDEDSEGPLRNESVPTHGRTTTSSSSSAATHNSSHGRGHTQAPGPAQGQAAAAAPPVAAPGAARVYTNFDDSSSSSSEAESDGPAK